MLNSCARCRLQTASSTCNCVDVCGCVTVGWKARPLCRHAFQQLFHFTVPFPFTPPPLSLHPCCLHICPNLLLLLPSEYIKIPFRRQPLSFIKCIPVTHTGACTHTCRSNTVCSDPVHWAESTFQLFITKLVQQTGPSSRGLLRVVITITTLMSSCDSAQHFFFTNTRNYVLSNPQTR